MMRIYGRLDFSRGRMGVVVFLLVHLQEQLHGGSKAKATSC